MMNDTTYKESHAGHILKGVGCARQGESGRLEVRGAMKLSIFEKMKDPNTTAEEKKKLQASIKHTTADFKSDVDFSQWHVVKDRNRRRRDADDDRWEARRLSEVGRGEASEQERHRFRGRRQDCPDQRHEGVGRMSLARVARAARVGNRFADEVAARDSYAGIFPNEWSPIHSA